MRLLSRRTVITFEKLERSYLRFDPDAAQPVRDQCAECGQEVTWLTPNQMALLSTQSVREVFRRIEAATIHYREVSPDQIQICSASFGSPLQPPSGPDQRA